MEAEFKSNIPGSIVEEATSVGARLEMKFGKWFKLIDQMRMVSDMVCDSKDDMDTVVTLHANKPSLLLVVC